MTDQIKYTQDDGSTRELIGFAKNYPNQDFTSAIPSLMNPFGISSGIFTVVHDLGQAAAGNMGEHVAIARITDAAGQQKLISMREEALSNILEQENLSAGKRTFASSALDLLQKSHQTDIDPISGQEMQKIHNLDASMFGEPNQEISLQIPSQSEIVLAGTPAIVGSTL